MDAVKSTLSASECFLLDAALRRRAKERVMSAVLKPANKAPERGRA